MNVPPIIAAGDAPSWDDCSFLGPQSQSINSSVYALSYSFRGAAGGVDVNSAVKGSGWTTALTAAQTAAMNVGTGTAVMFWQAYAVAAAGRILAGDGRLTVKPNLAALGASAAFDGTTVEEQILVVINAEIKARVSGGATIEYTIGTRSLKKEPMSGLVQLKEKYAAIVVRQRRAANIANGLGNPANVGVRFR